MSAELVDGMNKVYELAFSVGSSPEAMAEKFEKELEELEQALMNEYPEEKGRILNVSLRGFTKGLERLHFYV